MIDFVRGAFVYAEEQAVVLDVHGIGYRIFVPVNVAADQGAELLLHTHFIVREDVQALYGFSTREERDLFRLLLEVSGVGPKAAMAMLSRGNPQQLVAAVRAENIKFLITMPGIGKKTAQRIILDLKDKLPKWDHAAALSVQKTQSVPLAADQEAIEALLGLGYNEEEAERAVSLAQQAAEEALPTTELIRRALQVSMRR